MGYLSTSFYQSLVEGCSWVLVEAQQAPAARKSPWQRAVGVTKESLLHDIRATECQQRAVGVTKERLLHDIRAAECQGHGWWHLP